MTGWCCAGALMLLPCTLAAKEIAVPQTPPGISLQIGKQAGAEFILEIREAPLARVLKEIADKTGTRIHYSVLPDAPVTATCVGATVGHIMDCLVAKQLGLVANKPDPGQPAEFWLLGSSVGSCQAMTIDTTPVPAEQPVVEAAPPLASKEQTEAVLAELKQAKTTDQRNEALSHFTMGADIHDPSIRKTLDDALTDPNPSVRVQALATVSALDKDIAAQAISRALQDTDRSVRYAAFENARDNRDLLEQAMGSSDESISGLAANKLAQLKRNQERFARP